MRSYQTARSMFGFLEFLGWMAIILGIIVAIAGAESISRGGFGRPPAIASLMAAMPGLAVSFLGLVGVVQAQIGRAGVDTAELTQQMLKVARDQLEVSKQSLSHSKSGYQSLDPKQPVSSPEKAEPTVAKGYENKPQTTPVAPAVRLPDNSKTIEYRGQTILKRGDEYFVDGIAHKSLHHAENRINRSLG